MRIHILLIAFTLPFTVFAQEDVEYRMDIGAGVGATTYYGDFNASPTKNIQPAAAIVFRDIINPHMAIRLSGMYTKVKGSYDPNRTYYPNVSTYTFNNSLADLSATYEYNFWPYGTGKDYRGAKRLTPFLSIGVGVTYANIKADEAMKIEKKNLVTANVPIGVGVKYRYKDRYNFSLDWQMHFSLSDELDGIKDPYGISSNGLFKNTDCYSTLTLAFTYSFSEKCRTCHKE